MTAHELNPHPYHWRAKWIWGPTDQCMDNYYLLARKLFDVTGGPRECTCRVTASNIYELYVNGRRVGRGPSPSNAKWQYYDSYDLTGFLREGANIIAAHCYNYGTGMDSVLKQELGPGGFLFELRADGEILVATEGSWVVLRDPSHKIDTEPISGHRGGFKDVFDARVEPVGWLEAAFDDSAWQSAIEVGSAGCEPWIHLIPREIPPIRIKEVAPRDVFYHSCGKVYGSPTYDVAWPEALVGDDDRVTIVEPLAADFAPTVFVDFGVNVYGYFEIEIEDSSGGTLEISYGESLNLTLVDTVIMRRGRQVYRCFERRGGRYVALALSGLPGPVRIRRVLCHRQSYPVEELGSFRCSDEMLNRIWEIGAYTVRMCMQEHYEDCPWREQTLYDGDIAVGALLSYYAFGTRDLARKCLRQFARIQRPDGLIPTYGPTAGGLSYLPEYAAFWVIALYDYYKHWGDIELVLELHQNLTRCMEWYFTRTDSEGLFTPADGDNSAHFIDNLSGLSYADKTAAEQIIYRAALVAASELARAAGNDSMAADYSARSDKLAQAIETTFWRDDTRTLADTADAKPSQVNQITNGLALLYDVVGNDRRPHLARVLTDRTAAPPVRAGYMNFYLVEALAKHGDLIAALARIREYWGAMVSRGATSFWETFDPSSRDGTIPERLWSLCHEFCAGPVYSLPAHVTGIRALEPGFAKVEIAPNLCGLDWAKARVPTPRGIIEVVCCADQSGCVDMDVFLPANVSSEVLVPLPGRDIATIYVDDRPVEEAWEAGGHRLVCESSLEARHIRIRTSRQREFAPGAHIVEKPWGEWDATPA